MRLYPSICLQIFLLFSTFVPQVAPQSNPHCNETCGNLSIPYPFGVGDGCYLNEDFNITCNFSYNPPKPFLWTTNLEITEIDIKEGQLSLLGFLARECKKNNTIEDWYSIFSLAKLSISKSRNMFTVIGCDSYAYLQGYRDYNYSNYYQSGCMSLCQRSEYVDDTSCSGSGCCQTQIPDGLFDITVQASSFYNYSNVSSFSPCTYAFVVDESKFNFSRENLKNMPEKLPIVVDWSVDEKNTTIAEACKDKSMADRLNKGGKFRCTCENGYDGNPYLGCDDIDECKDKNSNNCTHNCKNINGSYTCSCPKWFRGDGRRDGKGCALSPLSIIFIMLSVCVTLIVAFVGGTWFYLTLKHRRDIKLKARFYRENGGFLLQQKLSGQEGMSSSITIFTAEELEKATSNYDESMIIGRGGYGTVYKGIFPDNREVAIKRSISLDHSQVEQFVNEVLILSQINHRNVVRLLGCCLETEVPMLVYEFISNGTLFEHIHQKDDSSFPWEMRLKVAAETAGALTYLHSAASVPIIHRDVKTTNILLGPDYTAKVSDFGASKFVPQDEIQMSTMVQGTLGYLDPEYLLTSELSDKSDVYSFGVVLVELLTRLKPISFERPEAQRSLAMYFVLSIKHDGLFDIIDSELIDQGKDDQIKEVALLAERCLIMKGEKRPSMKEVAMELEGLLLMGEKHPWDEVNLEETEHLLLEHGRTYGYDGGATSSSIMYDSLKDQAALSIGSGR